MITTIYGINGDYIGEEPGWWPINSGDYLVVGGEEYRVYSIKWDMTTEEQRVYVEDVPQKGSVTIEEGFSERDDMPVDKGGVPS